MENGQAGWRMIGSLLRIPREAAQRQVVDGLVAASFGDVCRAHFTVFQHLPPEGMRLTALAEAALMTKQSMGYLVDDLEARGYVERVPDPKIAAPSWFGLPHEAGRSTTRSARSSGKWRQSGSSATARRIMRT